MLDKIHRTLVSLLFCSLCMVFTAGMATDLTDLYPDEEASEALDTLAEDAVESTGDMIESVSDSAGIESQDPITVEEDESSAISNLLSASDPYALPKDVVMVLDNSGSMKKNDPEFLATKAVSEFISSLDNQTRIAVVIFDQSVSLAVPLTDLTF